MASIFLRCTLRPRLCLRQYTSMLHCLCLVLYLEILYAAKFEHALPRALLLPSSAATGSPAHTSSYWSRSSSHWRFGAHGPPCLSRPHKCGYRHLRRC